MRGSALAILAGGVAACSTTPTYPPTADRTAAQPVRPTYPIGAAPGGAPPSSAQAAPQPTSAAQSAPEQVETSPAATGSVQTHELAPLTPPASPPPSNSPPPRAPPVRYAAAGRVVTPRGMYRDYAVQRHDHLDAIARDLETTPDSIVEANHLKTPNHLVPGQHLRIPVEKAYVAKAGDTLAVVAQRFSVSVADLADLNDLSERARLKSGEEIALPAAMHDRGPVQEKPLHFASISPISPVPPAYGRNEDAAPLRGAYSPGGPTYAPSSAYEGQGPALSDTQIAALAHNRFVWPVQGEIINGFGSKGLGVRNDGIDVRSPEGATVHAAAPGEVVYAGNQIPGYGNLVLVQHADGWVTAYAHLSRMSVQMRQHVEQGQEVGLVGTSGGVGEPELHFEVRYKASVGETARPIDPMLVLAKPASG